MSIFCKRIILKITLNQEHSQSIFLNSSELPRCAAATPVQSCQTAGVPADLFCILSWRKKKSYYS